MCGYDILAWLEPDVAAHVSGGPIPMSDADLMRTIEETAFALEICSSGNDRSTLLAARRLKELGRLDRLTLGTDTPGGTGVIPRGMLRNILYLGGGVRPRRRARRLRSRPATRPRRMGSMWACCARARPPISWLRRRSRARPARRSPRSIAHGDLPGISHVLVDGEPWSTGAAGRRRRPRYRGDS